MKISDFPEDIEPRVGDIIEIEQDDVCFEVRIIGITEDGYLCEQDNIQGAVLLEGTGLNEEDATDIEDFLRSGGKIQQLPYKNTRKEKSAHYRLASRHIGGSGHEQAKGKLAGLRGRAAAVNVSGTGKAVVGEEKVRLDPKCWDGYKKQGTKIKGGVRVNNCVPEGQEDIEESGLQYYTGVKKHGAEYMKRAAKAGREGASQEELGRLRDRYSKAEKTKESVEQEVAESTEQSLQKKIQAKRDALGLAREQRRARGQHQQGQREIKLQAEIDKLSSQLTQMKKQDVAEAGPFSYGYKPPRKGSVAYWAEKKRKEQEKGKPPIEPKDQMVGIAKVTKGVAEGEGKTQKYEMMMRNGQVKKFVAKDDADAKRIAAGHGAKSVIRLRGGVPAGKVAKQGVAEGMFGLDSKVKAKILNIVERLSDEYGMWDHKAQTFTPEGLETLKSILKFNENYIKYALSLTHKDYEAEGVAEDISSTKKKISKYEELALAANRAGDDAKCKQYQQKIQVLKQKMSQGVAEGYTGRETKDGTWRVFKDGQAVAVAGPFKSRDEAHAWIKKHKPGVSEAKSLKKRVRVVQGEHAGKTGWIREIKHGIHSTAPKRYYVDIDGGGQADNLPASALRLLKDQSDDQKGMAMEDNGFSTFMQQLQTTSTDNPVQIVVYGKMPAHMRAEEVWDALMEILPNEYPSILAAQQTTAEIARSGGAVVATRPRSEAQKIVKQFNVYGIKARINTSEGVAVSKQALSEYSFAEKQTYMRFLAAKVQKYGPQSLKPEERAELVAYLQAQKMAKENAGSSDDNQFSLGGKIPATNEIPQDSVGSQRQQQGMDYKMKQQTINHILELRPEWGRSDLELSTLPELIQMLRDIQSGKMTEAEYQGRKVALGKPMAGDVKKSKVYVRKPNGKVVKVNFGDKTMKIKKSNPNRRKSFRARHNCENPGPRWKARYWSCRAW